MATYFKLDIPRWQKGTASLSDRAYRVYHCIIEQIMIAEGPILYHDKTLAGLSNRSTRDLRAAIDELVAAGKIIVDGNMIHNERCDREIDALNKRRGSISAGRREGEFRKGFADHSPEKIGPIVDEWSANGAPTVREPDKKSNENNDNKRVELAIDKTRQDKKNKQKSEASSVDQDEADASPKKSVKEILLEVLDPKTASALIAHRKAKRAPLTPLAAEGLVKQFREYGDPQWAVETILTQGWQGFRPGWMVNFPRPAATGEGAAQNGPDWREILDFYCRTKSWSWASLSPEPNQPGCKIPADIIAEFAGRLPPSPFAARAA